MNDPSGHGPEAGERFECVTGDGQSDGGHVSNFPASLLQELIDFDFFHRCVIQPGKFAYQACCQYALD